MNKFENVNYGMVALVAVIAAVISSLVTYKAMNRRTTQFAIVDLQQIVVVSKDVSALRMEREKQVQDLRKMADDANSKITAEKDEAKKKQLSEQYLAEINARKAEYDKLYAASLQASDKKLNEVIREVAAQKGLSAVLSKSAVVDGGEDITDEVIKQIQ